MSMHTEREVYLLPQHVSLDGTLHWPSGIFVWYKQWFLFSTLHLFGILMTRNELDSKATSTLGHFHLKKVVLKQKQSLSR